VKQGIGLGLVEAGWEDVKALGAFLADPVAGVKGIYALISDPEVRAKLGDEVVADLKARGERIEQALSQGGFGNAAQLGRDMGHLAYQTAGALTGVVGAAKASVTLARAGIKVSTVTLDKAAATTRALVKEERGSLGPGRPSWRQSEIDVGKTLGTDAKPQVSYKGGDRAGYGTPGSTRPDWTSGCGSVCVEVKNYNLTTNVDGLIRNTAEQAVKRQPHLPEGMVQTISIDVRGQKLTDAVETKIRKELSIKSNGLIKPSSIKFIEDR